MTTPKTPSPVLGALLDARALITDRQRWTTRVLARTYNGEVCDPWDASARCWCLEGALRRVDVSGAFIVARKELATTILNAPQAFGISTVSNFNDSHTHAEVLDLIDRTIERLS